MNEYDIDKIMIRILWQGITIGLLAIIVGAIAFGLMINYFN